MSIVKAYIVPHPPMIIEEIGNGREKVVQTTIDSYKEIAKEIKKIKPETIIIISPHATMYSDWFHIIKEENIYGNLKNFGREDIEFQEKSDLELLNNFNNILKEEEFPAGAIDNGNHELDHGEMVPLYFIEKELKDFKLLVIGLSGLPLVKHYELGMLLNKAIEKTNRKVVLLSSGDLSHVLKEDGPYGFREEGPIYEKEIEKIIKKAEFKELMKYKPHELEIIGDCGHRSFTIMAGCFNSKNVDVKIYSHEDTTGVGYLIGRITPKEDNNKRNFFDQYLEEEKERINKIKVYEDDYLKLARKTINNYILNNEKDNTKYPKKTHNGVFVTIYEFNQLRGCIGTILPITNSIESEIIENAIEAATNDPRFPKIKEDELDYLEIHVDILTKPTIVKSIYELNPKKYGIICLTNTKKGLLLPNIEGIDEVEEQVKIALKKGNIQEDENYIIEKFEVERHEVKEKGKD